MKISRDWLQKYFEVPLPSTQELADALTFHAFEIESVEGDILDVKITPNRGHDCLSYRGIAREVSAILNVPLASDPLAEKPQLPQTGALKVHIEDERCLRYIGGVIKGVHVGPSPSWLIERLAAMGQKSINNVVDATNFVMFNIGQPLHAFDTAKLAARGDANAIEIRRAKEGEKILALDAKEYTLTSDMLVIADKHADVGIGVAGVKGGEAAGITEATTHIILESANFDGASVRKTAKALGLRTDASQRFEQVISPELAAYGMRAAADLIVKLAGGEIVGFVDAYPQPAEKRELEISLAHINNTLDLSLSREQVADVFTRLGFAHRIAGDSFSVIVPFERLDLEISEDLVEEVGRIIGYDSVPAHELPTLSDVVPVNQNFAASERVREELTALGYSEVITSVFQDEGERAVLNKVDSVRPYLRSTLTHGLNEALKKNVQNKDLLGLKEVKIFEIGTVWTGGEEKVMARIVSETESAKEDPLSMYVRNTDMYETLPLSATERYQPFSRFPSITRDISMWVPPSMKDAGEAYDFVESHAGNLLQRIDVLDEFVSPKHGRRSLALRLVFQSFEKTLTDDEVKPHMDAVYAAVTEHGFEVR